MRHQFFSKIVQREEGSRIGHVRRILLTSGASSEDTDDDAGALENEATVSVLSLEEWPLLTALVSSAGASPISVSGGGHEEVKLLGEANPALRGEGAVRYEHPHIHKFSQGGGGIRGAAFPPAAQRFLPRLP